MDYNEYENIITSLLEESDSYFKGRSWFSSLFYPNIGVDLVDNEYCGNTLLCASYIPNYRIGTFESKNYYKNMSVVAGEIIIKLLNSDLTVFNSTHIKTNTKDFHLFKHSPIRMQNNIGIVLFCILCSINYVTCFINKYYVAEIPQKFKLAYLQYYYLCSFIPQINLSFPNINLKINDCLQHREFRNCLAHYGLGQFFSKDDIVENDLLFGLTEKAFHKNYYETKELLFAYLDDLTEQIKNIIF